MHGNDPQSEREPDIRETLVRYDNHPQAPDSLVLISIAETWHGINRAAFWLADIDRRASVLMYAPLDVNDYPAWDDATEVELDLIEPWLADIATRATATLTSA